MKSVRVLSALVIVGACLLSGCGYAIRSGLVTGVETIAVPTFGNETHEHLLDAKVTDAIQREFVSDGALRVVEPERADAVLEGTVTGFEREPYTLGRDDTEVEQYRLRVTVSMRLRKRGEEKLMWKEEGVWGDATYHLSGALARSEGEALAEALQDLARKIVDKTVRRW